MYTRRRALQAILSLFGDRMWAEDESHKPRVKNRVWPDRQVGQRPNSEWPSFRGLDHLFQRSSELFRWVGCSTRFSAMGFGVSITSRMSGRGQYEDETYH